MDIRREKCPYCKSKNIVPNGNLEYSSVINADVLQSFYCEDCITEFRIHYRLVYVKTEKDVGY